jgi:hypothetical protein
VGPVKHRSTGAHPTQPVSTDNDRVRAWQLPVDQLAGGGEFRLRRNDLPDWHAERFAGDVNDEFVLGADDVLRFVQPSVSSSSSSGEWDK